MDILSNDFVNPVKHKLASWEQKSKLFAMHREAFPEICEKEEITKRLKYYAGVKSLLTLPEMKAREIETFLVKALDKRTEPGTDTGYPF